MKGWREDDYRYPPDYRQATEQREELARLRAYDRRRALRGVLSVMGQLFVYFLATLILLLSLWLLAATR